MSRPSRERKLLKAAWKLQSPPEENFEVRAVADALGWEERDVVDTFSSLQKQGLIVDVAESLPFVESMRQHLNDLGPLYGFTPLGRSEYHQMMEDEAREKREKYYKWLIGIWCLIVIPILLNWLNNKINRMQDKQDAAQPSTVGHSLSPPTTQPIPTTGR